MVDLVAKLGSPVLLTREFFFMYRSGARSWRCSSATPGARLQPVLVLCSG